MVNQQIGSGKAAAGCLPVCPEAVRGSQPGTGVKTGRKEVQMKDKNCIFCRINSGQIPSATLYEDPDFRVILDINPVSKGHALIIPKEHYEDLFEIPRDTLEKAAGLSQKIAGILKAGLDADGFNLLQNNGKAGGQMVPHFHIHLIPRYRDDGIRFRMKSGKLEDTEREEILELFQSR